MVFSYIFRKTLANPKSNALATSHKLKSASVRLLTIFFVDTMHHGALGYNQHRGKVHHNPRNKGAEDSNKNPQQSKQYLVDIEVFPNPSYDTGDYVVFA